LLDTRILEVVQLVRDIYATRNASGQPVISFEFFPPKTPEGDRNLLEKTIPALLKTKPDYCSVTYGAGGSTRDKTLLIVDRIQRQHGLTAVAHLTCVCATREQIADLLGQIRDLGVRNILALRGDPPGGGEFKPTPAASNIPATSFGSSGNNKTAFLLASRLFRKAILPAKRANTPTGAISNRRFRPEPTSRLPSCFSTTATITSFATTCAASMR